MVYYFAIDIFILLSSFYKKYQRLLIPLLFFVLFIFTAFRPGLGGTDYKIYERLFNEIPPIYELELNSKYFEYDFLYVLLNSLVKTFTDNFVVFIALYTLLTQLAMFSIIKDYSKDFFYSMFIYFSTYYLWHNFTLLRQNIAILIFWFSIRYIKKGNFWKYSGLIVVASLFHNSAILLIPFYFILRMMNEMPIEKKYTFTMILCLLKPISDILLNIIYLVLIYLNVGRSNLQGYLFNASSGINPLFIIESLLILFLVYLNRNDALVSQNKIFVDLLLLSLILSIWFSNYEIFARFVEYFRIYYLVLIPILIGNIKNIYSRYSAFLITIAYFLFRLYRYLVGFDGGSLMRYTLF